MSRRTRESHLWAWFFGGAALAAGGYWLFNRNASAASAPGVVLQPGVQSVTAASGSTLTIAPPAGATWASSSAALIFGGGMSTVATPQGTSTPVSIVVSDGLSVFDAAWTPAGSNAGSVSTAVLVATPGVATTGIVSNPALVASAQAMLATVSAKRQIPNLSYSVGASNFATSLSIFQQYVNAQNSGVTLTTTGNLDYPTFAVLVAAAAGA